MNAIPPEPDSPHAQFLRRELIRIKAIRKLPMRERFFVTDIISLIDRRMKLTDKQMAWVVAICEANLSKKEKRIRDAIDALKKPAEIPSSAH